MTRHECVWNGVRFSTGHSLANGDCSVFILIEYCIASLFEEHLLAVEAFHYRLYYGLGQGGIWIVEALQVQLSNPALYACHDTLPVAII